MCLKPTEESCAGTEQFREWLGQKKQLFVYGLEYGQSQDGNPFSLRVRPCFLSPLRGVCSCPCAAVHPHDGCALVFEEEREE